MSLMILCILVLFIGRVVFKSPALGGAWLFLLAFLSIFASHYFEVTFLRHTYLINWPLKHKMPLIIRIKYWYWDLFLKIVSRWHWGNQLTWVLSPMLWIMCLYKSYRIIKTIYMQNHCFGTFVCSSQEKLSFPSTWIHFTETIPICHIGRLKNVIDFRG